MNAVTAARQSELDKVLDAQPVLENLSADLFAIADLLADQASLRNALSDPTAPEQARRELATAVLTGRVSQAAVTVAQEAAALSWSSASDLTAAVERQAVRALIGLAQAGGTLDLVEDELFRFVRIVEASSSLRSTLADFSSPLAARQQVVTDLLAAKATPVTVSLARRAVAASERTFELTMASYLFLAAAARNRTIAHVTLARPLSQDQAARVRSALSRQVGREVTLQVVIDPTVIGGAMIRLGDEVIDGTVAGKLEAAQRQLN